MEPASVCPACATEIPPGREFCPRCLAAPHATAPGWLVGLWRMSPTQWLIAAGALYAAGFAVGGLAH